MTEQSGRSLVEIIGVMAIGGILMAALVTTYNTVRARQVRTIAAAQLEQIAKNTRLLLEQRHNYSGVSVDYLVKSGALKNTKAPIGNNEWSITSSVDSKEFLINLKGLTKGECDYFTTVNLDWAERVKVNGFESDPGTYCLTTGENEVSFIVQ
ncbi:MAG: type II secretion system GspH family protein [Rickettsiales bacterium]|jgi:Tfp pilus assembly protein PilE|nr:type II secretion system GspH family protein [Rickettsiales bacterium]